MVLIKNPIELESTVPYNQNICNIQREEMTKFEELLKNITGHHVYIQTHNFPDPDAISSAFGLQNLFTLSGIESSICYKGKIERYCTNEFVDKLGIKLINLDDIDDMISQDEIILVDSQKGNANIYDSPGEEIICIDHHPTFDVGVQVRYRFSDIRPEVGACASIIADYYFENNITMDKNTATALAFGIKSDTQGLSRGASDMDVDMFHRLYLLADLEVLNSLEHCSLMLEDLQAYANAIGSIKIINDISFAYSGNNIPEALIASISDFMLDLVEVMFTVVYSAKSDGIKLSVRSATPKYDAGKITSRALAGIGSGGGHQSMAGGFVPFTNDLSVKYGLIENIQQRFLNIINE